MIRKHSHRAFVSYDAMFSILPVVFMVSLIIQMMALTISDASYAMSKREKFNLLVTTADYAIKKGAAKSSENVIFPNWLDESLIPQLERKLSTEMNKDITIGFNPQNDKTCVYRLVVVGGERPEEGTIKKLYVCG
ncbi:MAG: hypothetical protein QW590_00925 [Candidatus Bilamarchaeaceae archaeon]